MNGLFIAVSFCVVFVAVFSFFAAAISFFCRENAPRRLFYIPCSRPAPWSFFTIMKCFCTTCEACTQQCAWLLKRLVFAEAGDLTSWHKTMNCYRARIVCLDAKGLWKPGQSFILAGFTLSLPCSAPCGTEQTTVDTGCDPALPRNCVDDPADCNPFKTTTLLNLH